MVHAYTLPETLEKDGVLWAGDGWIVEEEGIRVAYFTGTPLEIGIQQGLLSAQESLELLELWRSINPSYQAQGSDRVLWLFRNLYARLQFYPAFKRYTPHEYLEEMQGFILGASQGEESDFYEIFMGNASQDLELAACSAFAAWGEATLDGDLYVGRNLDHTRMAPMAKYQYLAFYNPHEGYPFVVHNYPSFVGTMSGMNREGIVITSNYSIAKPSETTIYGLPYMLVMRRALQYSGSIEEVIEYLLDAPRTVGLNLMVADGERAVIVELTANRLVVREEEEYIFATNQFIHPYMKEYQAHLWLASAKRDKRFETLIQENWGQIDVEVARDIMRDKFEPGSPPHQGFLRGINSESNMASMVFVPSRGEVYLGRIGDIEGHAPFAGDNAFIGFDAQKIWETGLPQKSIGILPATKQEGYDSDWFSLFDAFYLQSWGEYEEALLLTKDVLRRHPEAEMPLYLTGRLFIHLGDIQEGFHYLEQYLNLDSHSEPFYYFLALVWSGLIFDTWGEREEAITYYREALEVDISDMPGELTGFRLIADQGTKQPLYVDSEGQIGSQ